MKAGKKGHPEFSFAMRSLPKLDWVESQVFEFMNETRATGRFADLLFYCGKPGNKHNKVSFKVIFN